MMIRRAAIQDLEQIMQIYARAVQYMQASGPTSGGRGIRPGR